MSNTAAVLAAMSNMQSSVQSSVPFTPNNGNPAGAYNMPQGQQPAPQQAQPANPWPWLEPSPFMQQLQQDLAARSRRLQQEIATANSDPIVPAPELSVQQQVPVQQPSAIPQPGLAQAISTAGSGLPVLPVRNQTVY